MRARTKLALLLGFVLVFLAACGAQGEAGPAGETGPQGEQGPPGPMASIEDLGCTDCHNETGKLAGITLQWEESVHATGDAFLRGSRSSCAGCHSGNGFSERVAAGLTPAEVETGDPFPTKQDCRTCHQIHTTYTGEDFALETTAAVAFYAFEGAEYDGGKGNLCASCHQPRRDFPAAVDGQVEITSTHWGPHHGGQGSMLLGIAGAGVEGNPSKHFEQVENTCVGCHMVESNHSYEPSIDACTECHESIESFDLNGVQTEVKAKLDELEGLLVAAGYLDEEGHPAVQTIPEEFAAALWNWIYIAHEDGSYGVHNPSYTLDLLDASIATFE